MLTRRHLERRFHSLDAKLAHMKSLDASNEELWRPIQSTLGTPSGVISHHDFGWWWQSMNLLAERYGLMDS